jgi:FeS assembly SUF system regulator
MSKLADYSMVLLLHAARTPAPGQVHTARSLALATGLPLPTVTKVLKRLTRGGLLRSQRGASGGYALARPIGDINLVEVLTAIDGPPALTQCTDSSTEDCERERICPTRANWRLIHRTVVNALENLTLADLAAPPRRVSRLLTLEGLAERSAS